MLSRSKLAFGRSQMQASALSLSLLHEYFYNIPRKNLFFFFSFFLRKIYMRIYNPEKRYSHSKFHYHNDNNNNNNPLEQIRKLNKYKYSKRKKERKKIDPQDKCTKENTRTIICCTLAIRYRCYCRPEWHQWIEIKENNSRSKIHPALTRRRFFPYIYNRILLIPCPLSIDNARHGSLKL